MFLSEKNMEKFGIFAARKFQSDVRKQPLRGPIVSRPKQLSLCVFICVLWLCAVITVTNRDCVSVFFLLVLVVLEEQQKFPYEL